MNFREKRENVMFLHFLRLSYMQKIRKFYRAVFREKGGETERQKDRKTERERTVIRFAAHDRNGG